MHLVTAHWLLILTARYVNTSRKSYWTEKVSYEGVQLWRVAIGNFHDVILLKALERKEEISLWSLKPKHAVFLVHADQKELVNLRLNSQYLNHSVLLMDVQHQIDKIAKPPTEWNEESLRIGHRLDFTFYPDMQVIMEYMSFIKEQYASICTVQTIGRSGENREIQMVVVSNRHPTNKAILVTGGMHAREWISIASLLYILNDILSNFDNQPTPIRMVDWYIVPVVNPDGYIYSHTNDRLWRKNRRPLSEWTKCIGVDINRNFGMNWFVEGITETESCSEGYGGESAFSEPESVAIKNVAAQKKMSAFVDIHAYSQTIMYPYSSQESPIKDKNLLEALAKKMSTAMFSIEEHSYVTGSVYHLLYPCSGSALDYMYSSGVPIAYVLEGRDEGYTGFLLPPSQIHMASVEVQVGLYTLAESL